MAYHSVSDSVSLQPVQAGAHSEAFLIQTRCHLFPWSESVFIDCLSPPYFAYQLQYDSQVVGYYVGLNVAGEATLMDIGLSPTSRGKGFGNALMVHFLEQCRQRDCDVVWLEVRLSNEPAINLYEKYGFIRVEIRKNYYKTENGNEDALIMKKGLLDQQGRLIE